MKLKLLFTLAATTAAVHAWGYAFTPCYPTVDKPLYLSEVSELERTAALECGNTEDNMMDAPMHSDAIDFGSVVHLMPCRYWVGGSYSGDVVIPGSIDFQYSTWTIVDIRHGAFTYCELNSLSLPETLRYIGSGAFYHCKIDEIIIPDNVEYVGPAAFSECRWTKRIHFPSEVTVINNNTFYEVGLATDTGTDITGLDNVTHVGKEGLSCRIKEFPAWKKLKQLDDKAFCYAFIEYAHLPVGCILGEEVFKNCSRLKTVELPHDCPDNIDKQFHGCKAIELIRIDAVNPPALSDDWSQQVSADCVLEVPAQSLDMYRSTPYWKEFRTIRALTTSNTEVTANSFQAAGLVGAISVQGCSGVSIYDMQGTCIYQGKCGDIAAAPGIYIVKSVAASVKVHVL